MKKNKPICSIELIPFGKHFKVKVGKSLTEKSTKKEVFQKIYEISNILLIGHAEIHMIQNDPLPLFPKYEKEIMKNPLFSALYAHFFVKARWKKAEKVIRKDPVAFFIYCTSTIKTRELELEDIILESPELTFYYCKNVFKYKKIPEEIRNRMITHGIINPNNEFVKKFFNIKKNKAA